MTDGSLSALELGNSRQAYRGNGLKGSRISP
jgi:hypothetical protein